MGFPRKQARLTAFMTDLVFVGAPGRRAQIAVVCKHLRQFERKVRFRDKTIGQFLKAKRRIISAQFRKSAKLSQHMGRSPALSSEIDA
jgi:hypothetical protein